MHCLYMPLVSNELVKNNAGFGRTINQCIDLFVKPYLKKSGQTYNQDTFRTALIEIFDQGRKPKVKFGTDVSIKIEFNKGRTLSKKDIGKPVTLDLREIKDISWHEGDLDVNSAKILIMRFNKGYWVLNFDFRYNQKIVEEIKARATEFLEGTKTLLRKKLFTPHVLIYLLWSAAELTLDARLRQHAQETKNNHYVRKQLLEGGAGLSLVSRQFRDVLLKMYKIKNDARYANKDFTRKYNRSELKRLYRIIATEL